MLYDNIKLLSPSGKVVALIDKKTANWYVKHKLGLQSDGNSITLLFEPRNRSRVDDPFYLTPRENKCVVCGTSEDLTRHHVVPRFFRRHFPIRLKASSNHDVLAACVLCHRAYCVFEEEFKKELAAEFGLDISGKPLGLDPNLIKAASIIRTCLERGKTNSARVSFAKSFFRLCPNPSQRVIEEIAFIINLEQETNLGKAIVEILGPDNDKALIEFSKRWRRHFVTSMQPKHLPAFWDTEREEP